ncbi:hypothetical protein [Kineosporia babensis]|uniref:Uncharacterized protein n=1 Tax=Kineosporia babensis TaxID=499548 RepID=A0A9X1NKU6_9ACTN|nr:hypothetical protein [Kineosporia babensis]MCD5316155.1 hypothetical protein [Kineosporia babensis]
MQYIKFDTSVIMLVPDETAVPEMETRLAHDLLDINDVHRILVSARPKAIPARPGVCRIGGHDFLSDWNLPPDRDVPDVCREHVITAIERDHAEMFDYIREATNGELQPRIEHTGGGTMTIIIPLPGATGEDWPVPLYMGLQEDTNDLGRWAGGVGFYLTEDDAMSGTETTVVRSYKYEYTGREWAQQVAEHYRRLRSGTR